MDRSSSKSRVEHVAKAIQLIRSFVDDVPEKDFLIDIKLQSAVQYQFLVIGEAIKYIDDDILDKYDYPWHIPRSFRNFIIHEYHGVRMERIYYAAKDLDGLNKQVIQILENEF